MTLSPGPGSRFYEVQELLEAYAAHDCTFTDTPETPGPALSAYLRIVSPDPQRTADAVHQLDDILRTGLFSPEIADDIELLPKIEPPSGRGVEECLRIIREHLVRHLGSPAQQNRSLPQNKWEYRERFPELNQFLGAHFHQDFSDEYTSYAEAVDDYLSGASDADLDQLVRDVTGLLAMAATDKDLKQAVSVLGMDVSPPSGISVRRWLEEVAGTVAERLRR
ncbi:contact-dependent growth inhibition system immunity protein [Streptomyces sp. NPDC093586]|uniref:contact-dependent growth inhibition system immunity protein n=1 Tax=Streptomyces sp. NPDC093586 TaxID=3366042 RepID=UPI00382F0CEF